MERINEIVNTINGLFFHDYVVYILLATGLLFTIWSFFGQYRAMTHGVAVIRGKYDDKNDPGAINHFQALSAALSATVGLGNIGGVAAAVALGGPGAVFWMWVIGVVGMALKMTEVTQTMLFRNTDDPENPHGGPMFVIKKALAPDAPDSRKLGMISSVVFAMVVMGLGVLAFMSGVHWAVLIGAGIVAALMVLLGATVSPVLGSVLGGLFCITLLMSAITGGNMFQAWNVAEVTTQYAGGGDGLREAIGAILAVVVGVVIIGGIKRIGAVAGRLVPVMCALYLFAGLYVIAMNITAVPDAIAMIVRAGLGLENQSATGAFLGGSFGYAALFGIKRALFSSEAGQGSAPIAHAAAKCDEPVREGVVAGIEPFIDTIVVCTITALVILLTGAWNRGPEGAWQQTPTLENAVVTVIEGENPGDTSKVVMGRLMGYNADEVRIAYVDDSGLGSRTAKRITIPTRDIDTEAVRDEADTHLKRITEKNAKMDEDATPFALNDLRRSAAPADASAPGDEPSDPRFFRVPDEWVLNTGAVPLRNEKAQAIMPNWQSGSTVFTVLADTRNKDQGTDQARIYGVVGTTSLGGIETEEGTLTQESVTFVAWVPFESSRSRPQLIAGVGDQIGLYGDYVGANLTAHAFDRLQPGLGKYLIVTAAWLFALSTMISWSYYGEQAIYFMFGKGSSAAVLVYKLLYCVLVFVSSMPFIKTEEQLDMWTTLGLGAMLVVNIPLMLIFGPKAMNAYHEYIGKLKRGDFLAEEHTPASISDVVEGKDVE